MFRWLENRIAKKATDTARKEMESFVQGLKGMGHSELGPAVLMATVARNSIKERAVQLGFKEGYTLLSPFEFVKADPNCFLAINSVIKTCQKERNYVLASGFMVWEHTLRAVAAPELLPLAREMWAELKKGFPYVHDSYSAVLANPEANLPRSLWSDDYMEIPEGFGDGDACPNNHPSP